MRFHVLGICHTISNKEYISCAFTQKVVKFCTMMQCRDEDKLLKSQLSIEELVRHPTIHHIIHYGHEKSEVDADECVTVMTDEVLENTYGKYDWKKEFFRHKAYDLCHNTFIQNGTLEVGKRIVPGDFILCFWGLGHKDIGEKFANTCLVVEPGIGYPAESSFAQFKVFESYAKMHVYYGKKAVMQPSWYDCVIPNYFDTNDFDIVQSSGLDTNERKYYLYLGRIIRDKGVDVIIHLAKTCGFELLVAGQGSLEDMGYTDLPDNIKFVGYADLEKRKQLMNGAKALFLPTQYIEPFGGVVVEAQMCGTPVITTDWGVFNETVLHGITGYRCRTLDQFEFAIKHVDKLDRQVIKKWAQDNFGFKRVRIMYEEYFDMLLKLKFQRGFMEQNCPRDQLDWLTITYPASSKDEFTS